MSPWWTPERLYINEFLQRFRTRPAYIGSDIVFVYHHSGQSRGEETVLRYIFAKRLLNKNRGSTHLWLIFKWTLKEEKQSWDKLISGKEKKNSWFYSAEKKKEKMFKTIWFERGWVEMNISAPFSSFYSKEKKTSRRFLILVAPHPLRHSASIYLLCNGWRKRSMSLSHRIISFSSFRMEKDGGGGGAAQWYVPFPLLFLIIVLSAHRPLPIIPLTFCMATLCFSFLCFSFFSFETPRGLKLLLKKKYSWKRKLSCVQWSNYSRRIFIFLKRFCFWPSFLSSYIYIFF